MYKRATAVISVALVGVAACVNDAQAPSEPRVATTIWQARLRALGPPAIDERFVYFATRDHSLAAVDRATGAVRWTFESGITGQPSAHQTPVRAETVVVLGDEYLWGVDASTGARRWVFGLSPGLESRTGVYAFKTDGARIYAGSVVGATFAVQATTGQQVWRADLLPGEDNQVRVIDVRDGLVYVKLRYDGPFYQSKLIALDASTGATVWIYDAGRDALVGEVVLTPTNASRQLLFVRLDDGRIVALDAKGGGPRWTIPSLVGGAGGDDRRMTVSGDMLVATSSVSESLIIGYAIATGAEVWRVQSTQGSAMPLAGRATSDAELAFFQFFSGSLGAYEVRTGRARWIQTAPVGYFTSAPTISHDTLFVAGSEAAFAIRRQ